MKKKYINLFGKGHAAEQSRFNALIRWILTGAGVLLFAAFIVVNLFQISQQKELKEIIGKKNDLLSQTLNSKDTEAKMNYLKAKLNQLDTFSKDDTLFVPYYNLLRETLAQASNSSYLETISIDNKKNTKFSVRLNDFDSLMNFVHYVESDRFKDQFSDLILTSFNLLEGSKANKAKDYQLTFSGKFK